MSVVEAKALPDSPTDGISALSFLPCSPLLASTSWDGAVAVHDTDEWCRQVSHSMESGPLLSLTVLPDTTLVTGGLDGSIRTFDIETSTKTTIGRHTGEPSKLAVSGLGHVGENIIVSVGWNSQCILWDVRSQQSIATIDLPGKAFSMDVFNESIVVASSGRKLSFIEFKDGKPELVLERDSSLKYQSRCVRFFPDGEGIAVSSIEGRVAVEYDLPGNNVQKKKYAFKCHRIQDTVYPVNALAFHPKYFGTFATGGCDGSVVTWDGRHKKKLATLCNCNTSVAALAFNDSGTHLAIAASYTFEEGERDHPQDEILVRKMQDLEVQPKGS